MTAFFATRRSILVAAIVLLACACDRGPRYAPNEGTPPPPGAPEQGPKLLRFALIVKTQQNPVFLCMQRGAEKAAVELGAEVKTFSPAVEKNFQEQVELVRAAVRLRFDAILIAPADSRLLVAPLKEAADAGIPVVNIDNALDPAEMKKQGLETTAFVGVDNVAGGRLGAEFLCKAIGDSGEVAMLEGFTGVANAEDRKRGFHEQIATHPNVKIVASQTANWYTEEALQVSTVLLKKYPNLKGIFCANDLMALGAVRAAEQANRASIQIVGFDNIEPAREPLAKGRLAGTIEQFPDWMGGEAVRAANDFIKNGKLESRDRRSPLKMVTTAMVGTPDDVKPVGVR